MFKSKAKREKDELEQLAKDTLAMMSVEYEQRFGKPFPQEAAASESIIELLKILQDCLNAGKPYEGYAAIPEVRYERLSRKYKQRFGESFPRMPSSSSTEDEVMAMMEECLRTGKPYEPPLYDDEGHEIIY